MIVSLFGIGFDAVVNNDNNIYLLFICFTLFIIISSSRPAMSSSITVLLLGLTSCDSLLILTSILMFGKFSFSRPSLCLADILFYFGKFVNGKWNVSLIPLLLLLSKQEGEEEEELFFDVYDAV